MRVLIVDTPENATDAFVNLLQQYRLQTASQRADNKAELFDRLKSNAWDILLLNDQAKAVDVAECIAFIQENSILIAVVALTGKPIGVSEITEACRLGIAALVSLDLPEYSAMVTGREFATVQCQRRQLELARDNAELSERCQLLLSSSSEAIAYIHEGMHVFANDSYRRIFGFDDQDSVISTPFIDLVNGDCKQSLKSWLKSLQPGIDGEARRPEEGLAIVACREDGGEFKARLAIRPTLYDGEHCLQVLVRVDKDESTPAESATHAPELPASTVPERTANETKVRSIGTALTKTSAPADDIQVEAAVSKALADRNGELLCHPVIAVSDFEPEFYAVAIRLPGANVGQAECQEALAASPVGLKLDQWILDKALAVMSWHEKQGEALQFLVSLTAQSILDRKFADWLAGRIAASSLDSTALIIDFREKDVLANGDQARAAFGKLRDAGFRVCVSKYTDSPEIRGLLAGCRVGLVNFGGAISQRIVEDGNFGETLRDIVASLHASGTKVIAEDVDDTGTLSALWQAHVDLVQGDLLPAMATSGNQMKPLPGDDGMLEEGFGQINRQTGS